MRLNKYSYLKLQLIGTKHAYNRDHLFPWFYMHYMYLFLESLFFCHFGYQQGITSIYKKLLLNQKLLLYIGAIGCIKTSLQGNILNL